LVPRRAGPFHRSAYGSSQMPPRSPSSSAGSQIRAESRVPSRHRDPGFPDLADPAGESRRPDFTRSSGCSCRWWGGSGEVAGGAAIPRRGRGSPPPCGEKRPHSTGRVWNRHPAGGFRWLGKPKRLLPLSSLTVLCFVFFLFHLLPILFFLFCSLFFITSCQPVPSSTMRRGFLTAIRSVRQADRVQLCFRSVGPSPVSLALVAQGEHRGERRTRRARPSARPRSCSIGRMRSPLLVHPACLSAGQLVSGTCPRARLASSTRSSSSSTLHRTPPAVVDPDG